jgi:hypothetical protein
LATRIPAEITQEIINRSVDDIVTVSEEEIAAAIRWLFHTHNLAEGAGAVRSPQQSNCDYSWLATRGDYLERRQSRYGYVTTGVAGEMGKSCVEARYYFCVVA